MEQIRSFVAVELPTDIKAILINLQEILRAGDPTGAKWVDPESIHLTLKFLGNVEPSIIETIIQTLHEATQNIPPFQLEIKGLGAFPNLKRPQVIWLGLDGDLDRLQTLQKQVESGLVPLGFPAEGRSFTPHLTLARLRDTATTASRQNLGEIIAQTEIDANGRIEVSSISFMKSQLTRGGAIYTRLASVELKPSC
jgi:RNA 2',3'-cyclic 3'-phosphodiesterase